MTAECPNCGRGDCKVREHWTQATRQEPMRSLGYFGYCPECQCSFDASEPQLRWFDLASIATKNKNSRD
jgi:hypothetical protein